MEVKSNYGDLRRILRAPSQTAQLLFIRSNARFERYPQTMRQRSIRVFTRGQFLLQPRYFFFQTYSPGRGGQGYYFMPICQRIAREVIGQAVMILSRFVMRLSRDMGH